MSVTPRSSVSVMAISSVDRVGLVERAVDGGDPVPGWIDYQLPFVGQPPPAGVQERPKPVALFVIVKVRPPFVADTA